MPLEPSITYISDLNPAWPTSGDPKQRGDDHIRETKKALVNTFPLVAGPVPIAHDQFASKDYVMQAAYNTVLPNQPGGALPYRLISTNGASAWQLDSIFSNDDQLAEIHAVALSLG